MPYKSEILPNATLESIHKATGTLISFDQWLELRDRCRKDLWFLFSKVLKRSLAEVPQKELCEFFVKKNFDGVYAENYTLKDIHDAIQAQDEVRERLLLAPRGGTKSTINCVDCVQWVINCPDIRIFIETGEYTLARKFLREVKSYFYQPKDAKPTDFQNLFPEFILNFLDDQPLRCPARTERFKAEDFTCWVNSLTSSNAGWHCDLRKGDDVVTEQNSNNTEARDKLKDIYDNHGNLVDEWGFDEAVGTRYAPDDLYGRRLTLLESDPDIALKYARYQCWTVKPEFEATPLRDLQEQMVTLWFPEKLDFQSLRRKLRKNEKTFRCQQLNEPVGAEGVQFDINVLRSHLRPMAEVKPGDVFITWDWSLSSGKFSDFSSAAVARIGPSREINVLEIVWGRYTPSELAYQVISLARKWNPKGILIEKSNGAEFFQQEIARQAMRFQVVLPIFWKIPSHEADAKRNRVKSLEVLLSDGRLWFVPGSWIEETFNQLTRYTGERKNRGRKDDIPDALAYLQFFIPQEKRPEADTSPKTREEDLAAQKAAVLAARAQIEANGFNPFGGPPMPKKQEIIEPPAEADPYARIRSIFGGNGMHP